MEAFRIAQQQFFTACENQRGRQPLQGTEQGRSQGIFGAFGVAPGVVVQNGFCQGRVTFSVGLVGRSGIGQIDPGGDGQNTAGQGKFQLLQTQAQGVTQTAAGAFPAQGDSGISLIKKILIGFQSVLHCGGEGMLRGQTVGTAEYTGATFIGQRGAEASGIFQTAAGVAAAVQV